MSGVTFHFNATFSEHQRAKKVSFFWRNGKKSEKGDRPTDVLMSENDTVSSMMLRERERSFIISK